LAIGAHANLAALSTNNFSAAFHQFQALPESCHSLAAAGILGQAPHEIQPSNAIETGVCHYTTLAESRGC
jgi:hypothetical protein